MSIIKLPARLTGRKIALLGLGIENQALLNWFIKNKLEADITICDMRSPEALGERYDKLAKKKNIHWQLGFSFNRNLFEYDILFRSPGWTVRCPGIKEAKKRRGETIEATSALNLFLEICPTINTVGVTGTKGKGTTSSIITAILKGGFSRMNPTSSRLRGVKQASVYLGGNIGIAPFAFIDKIQKTDWVVLELSSFQLEDMTHSPKIAVFTNFTREHLAPADPNNPNYHCNMSEYWQAKANIFLNKENKFLIANQKLKSKVESQKSKVDGKIIYFTKSQLQTLLPGEHNLENIAAAEEVATIAKVPKEAIAKAVKKFTGLVHRIELVRQLAGVRYYDDSFATTPEATIIALRSFTEPITILLGGADKGADFKKLAAQVRQSCSFVVLLKGESTDRIKTELLRAGFGEDKMKEVDNIVEAVSLAQNKAQAPGVVLLSTACASFGMFKNYKERGDLFKEAVGRL